MLGTLLQVQPVNVSDSFKDTFNFLQGNGVYEDGMMHILQGMKASIWGQYDTFIADAQALAAIFMIIFFSLKAYEMMSGDKQLEVMPLLRPFALVMVILWWGTFTQVVAWPTAYGLCRKLDKYSKGSSLRDTQRSCRCRKNLYLPA